MEGKRERSALAGCSRVLRENRQTPMSDSLAYMTRTPRLAPQPMRRKAVPDSLRPQSLPDRRGSTAASGRRSVRSTRRGPGRRCEGGRVRVRVNGEGWGATTGAGTSNQ